MKHVLKFLFLLGLFLTVQKSATAAIYYVSPNGNDANPGTIDLPWQTVNRSVTGRLPGDTVYLRGGSYHEQVSVSSSGTATQPIVIAGYPGEVAAIDGNSYSIPTTLYDFLLTVRGNYVTVKDFEVRKSKQDAVAVTGDYDTVINLTVHDNYASGIILMGAYDTVRESTVFNNSQDYENCTWKTGYSAWGGALSCGPGSKYGTLSNNTVYNNWGEGLSAYTSGISVADHCMIQDNTSYNNGSVFLYIQNVTNATIRRNLIYRTADTPRACAANVGLQLGDEGQTQCNTGITVVNNLVMGTWLNFSADRNGGCTGNPLADSVIANNTFVNALEKNYDSGYNMAVYLRPSQTYSNTVFANNIILEDASSRLTPISVPSSHPGLTLSNNLYSKTYSSYAAGPGDIVADPQLARSGTITAGTLTGNWFKLMPTSPAIDKAITLTGITDDFFHNARDNAPDIGAHEYTATSAISLSQSPTPTPTYLPGDLNKDRIIDSLDYTLLKQNYGNTACGNIADINGDCKVTMADYTLLLQNYGKTN